MATSSHAAGGCASFTASAAADIPSHSTGSTEPASFASARAAADPSTQSGTLAPLVDVGASAPHHGCAQGIKPWYSDGDIVSGSASRTSSRDGDPARGCRRRMVSAALGLPAAANPIAASPMDSERNAAQALGAWLPRCTACRVSSLSSCARSVSRSLVHQFHAKFPVSSPPFLPQRLSLSFNP